MFGLINISETELYRATPLSSPLLQKPNTNIPDKKNKTQRRKPADIQPERTDQLIRTIT